MPPAAATVDPAEIARFEAIAAEWWDQDGKFRPLHRLNPVRLAWIRDRLTAHFDRAGGGLRPLSGLTLLDVGCGGGLVAEPMARLGARVTAIDAARGNVEVARLHARQSGLAIDYRQAAAEEIAAGAERFDVVLALEVIEHVADLDAFLGACARLVAPGGALVMSTLNRTPQAFLLAIVGAEYLLGWLPRGTHEWRKFVRPSELAAGLRPHGLGVRGFAGLRYDPIGDAWRETGDLSVNYLAWATR
jgi:2-polyprenyl-6-hydroxyphenyl methylase/3-demethylubiquinone-9 3-methyltransferase